jgi:hypothetical protein
MNDPPTAGSVGFLLLSFRCLNPYDGRRRIVHPQPTATEPKILGDVSERCWIPFTREPPSLIPIDNGLLVGRLSVGT